MGVAFSQNAGVANLHYRAQRQCSSTLSPPPPTSFGAEDSNKQSSSSSNSTSGTPSIPIAQQLQQSLKALSLDWDVVDRDIDLITLRFAALLLTSRLRVQRPSARRCADGEEVVLGASVNLQQVLSDNAYDAPSGMVATVVPSTNASVVASAAAAAPDNDDVGPQELYVSAALRLAALQLGRNGLQRVIVALAFLANGGESREERWLRRKTSLNIATSGVPIRRAESSLHEISQLHRGTGFTGSVSINAAAGGSSTLCSAAGNAFNTSGCTLHSLASSGSALAGRRFSATPHLQAQTQTQVPSTTNAGNAAPGLATSSNTYNNNSSMDHLAYRSPMRVGSTSVGHSGYLPHTLRQPSSTRSGGGEEAAYLLGASTHYHGYRSVSPLSAASGNAGVVGPAQFMRARPAAEVEFSTEEHSYNNILLTSMNARSTLFSPLRTDAHGELLYSNSSFATLMSFSTNAGDTHTGRSHRNNAAGGSNSGDVYNNSGAVRSPFLPFLHCTTQWVIPPAPLGSQAPFISGGGGGVTSTNSSMRTSLSSMVSPPSAPDSQQRSTSYSRRLTHPFSPYQTGRLSAVGAAGVSMLSRPASEEANLNVLTYQLPPAVGGGDAGLISLDSYASGYELAGCVQLTPSISPILRDPSLQFLRPEAVLVALCSVFAHLHLSADDVANLVTLLVVASLEVQTDAQLRRLAETDEEVASESLRTPSMKQIRKAVTDSLMVLLTPTYMKMRFMLCAAAGRVECDAQAAAAAVAAARFSSGGLECGNSCGVVSHPQLQQQQWQQQHTPLKTSVRTSELNVGFIPLPPAAPLSALTQSGDRNLSVPGAHLAASPSRSTHAATDDNNNQSGVAMSEEDLAAHVKRLHEFFETNVPLEFAPNMWSPGAVAVSARAAAAHRLLPTQRNSGTCQQQQQQQLVHQTITAKAAAAATYVHSSYSDSAAGPTSSGSTSRSDITDTAANFMSALPNRVDGGFTKPSQEEVRWASTFLMDVETAFVLHYAEVIVETSSINTTTENEASSKRKPATGSSAPSPLTQRLWQRTGNVSKLSAPNTSSLPSSGNTNNTPATNTKSLSFCSSTTKRYSWRRRGDADPDLFVQLASNTTVWPLRTRLLVRRHQYAYIYDAMASTMALLREENLYSNKSATATSATNTETTASRVPHPHTPIALIDLNKLAVERSSSDLQVLSGPGDVEVVSLMPSRITRNELASHQQRASVGPTATSAIAALASQASSPNSASVLNSPIDNRSTAHGTTGDTKDNSSDNSDNNSRTLGSFDDLLNYCWADAYQQDTEVYRVKGSTGTMHLLTVPAEADHVKVPISGTTTLSTSRNTTQGGSYDGSCSTGAAPTEGVIRAGVIHSFERNRLMRPAVLSLASPATTATGDASKDGSQRGDDVSTNNSSSSHALAGKGPRLQYACSDGNTEVLALELGNEPTRIAAYPLRLIYKSVLHHFFFSNPSARDHWYQQLLQLSWMTQSRSYLETVAAAPQDVGRFIRNRISFPTGPGAFECLDMLGAGTFGRVLLVQHKLSKRLFAMKVIRKNGFHGIRNVIEARREKKILDRLDCPYIMKIHSSFQTDSRVYLIFDYLPGAELLLHTQSAHSNHFDETTSRFYIAELAIAVEYLRVRGIVHRDIKGDNLVLDAEGHVVLTDFGFAKNIMAPSQTDPAAPPEVVRQHTSCGTLAYIAPEVLGNSRRGSGYGLAVDWWSLGVVLFTFLTGYFPFLKQTGPETSQAIVSSPLQFPPRPALSDDARSLLEQLLQKDPEKRIHCLADLRHHRFFEGFDWTACRERRLPPPLVLHKDSYRSPRTTADARQLLHDRVRRSLAWSTGQTDIPYVAPSHSRRSASDKLAIKHQPQLEEEQAELKLVEQAYGAECMPKPLSSANDVFGPLFEQQERCGSDRDESDVEDLQMENYVADVSHEMMESLSRMKERCISQELCRSFSDASVNIVDSEYAYTTGKERVGGGGAATGTPRHKRVAATPTLPILVNFNENLYGDIALAKYSPSAS